MSHKVFESSTVSAYHGSGTYLEELKDFQYCSRMRCVPLRPWPPCVAGRYLYNCYAREAFASSDLLLGGVQRGFSITPPYRISREPNSVSLIPKTVNWTKCICMGPCSLDAPSKAALLSFPTWNGNSQSQVRNISNLESEIAAFV